MDRRQWFMKVIITASSVVALLFICWSLAYYVTIWSYQRLDWQPHGLFRQLINSLLGFFFFGGFIWSLSPFIHKKRMIFFEEMINALKRISSGDFQVNLNIKARGPNNAHFGELVESINDMAINLKAMEDLRQEFISDVSHEIQSPLTSIGGFTRAMKDEELDRQKQLHYLEIIETESVRLSRLSENLLRLATLNSEHHPFSPEHYRLDKQLQSLILACEPQWLAKEMEMNVDLEEISIEADSDLLSQVWVNLIHNAIKFTPANGTVGISLEHQGEAVVVRIADTGIGIPEDDQVHIFERFFKADKSRNRSTSGSGLGLSIVNKIVEIHRGNITVYSKLGEGTAFTVSIPLRVN